MEGNNVQPLNLADSARFLSLVAEAKELLDKGASAEGRMEYMHKLKKAMLDEKSASLASKYAVLISEVMNPNTDSALNSDTLKKLGALVADKMDMEDLYNSTDPKMQSALKVIGALKGFWGLTDLLKHNLDPNDITKLAEGKIRDIGLQMLNEFDLKDNAMDLAKEGHEFFVAGTKLYALLSTQPLNPFALVHAGQKLLKEGADVLNEFNKTTPAIKSLVEDAKDGLNAIYKHASSQYSEYSTILEESYEDFKEIGTDFTKEMQENWEEANDGDGEGDGMINFGLSALQTSMKTSGKVISEMKETIKELIWEGHEDGDEKMADDIVSDKASVTEPVMVQNPVESQDDEVEVIHGFQGVKKEEIDVSMTSDEVAEVVEKPLEAGDVLNEMIPTSLAEVM